MASSHIKTEDQQPEKRGSTPVRVNLQQLDSDLRNDLSAAVEVFRFATKNWVDSDRSKVLVMASFQLLLNVKKILGYAEITSSDPEEKPSVQNLIDLALGFIDTLNQDKQPSEDGSIEGLLEADFPELGDELCGNFRRGLNHVQNDKLNRAKLELSELPRALSRYLLSSKLRYAARIALQKIIQREEMAYGVVLQDVVKPLGFLVADAEKEKKVSHLQLLGAKIGKRLAKFRGYLDIEDEKQLTPYQVRFLKLHNLLAAVLESREIGDVNEVSLSYNKACFEIIALYKWLRKK